VTMPLLEQFVICRLVLAMINLRTKLKVSMITYFEDMKANEKCKNWGGLGNYGLFNVIIR